MVCSCNCKGHKMTFLPHQKSNLSETYRTTYFHWPWTTFTVTGSLNKDNFPFFEWESPKHLAALVRDSTDLGFFVCPLCSLNVYGKHLHLNVLCLHHHRAVCLQSVSSYPRLCLCSSFSAGRCQWMSVHTLYVINFSHLSLQWVCMCVCVCVRA